MVGSRVRVGAVAVLLAGLALVVTGCSQGNAPGGDLGVTVSPKTLTVVVGQTADDTATVTASGYSGAVQLSLLNARGQAATGLSVSPSSVNVADGTSMTQQLLVAAAESDRAGTATYGLRATGGNLTGIAGLTVQLIYSGTFQTAVDYPAGAYPSEVAVGDFNGDGKPDLVIADYGGGVSVLLNKGDGTFQPPVDYGAGVNPHSVAVGDFNGDGKPDLAVANQNGTQDVSVLLNKGDGSGTFQPAVSYPAGSHPLSVAVGDFNGDGKLDLAIADYFGTVVVLLGNGDGTFQTAVSYPAGTKPYSVVVGDFNGDGKLDLAIADQDGGVSVLLGNGDGTFQTAVSYPAGTSPQSVAVGDFNGDGKPDLAVANYADNVSVLLGQ